MSETIPFGERLDAMIHERGSAVCVGIDPHLDLLPGELQTRVQRVAEDVERYFTRVIELTAPYCVAAKFQLAFFEALGVSGWAIYQMLVACARSHGLLVVADAKRGDIGSTAAGYARAHLAAELLPGVKNPQRADALTVNPYLGGDAMAPFVEVARETGAGLFCLVKTSNPGSADLQDLSVDGEPLYLKVADRVVAWGEPLRAASGRSSMGAVVGATHPQLIEALRPRLPGVPVLLPGYGAQGASAEDLRGWFVDGGGALVPASRSLAFAWRASDPAPVGASWEPAVAEAARRMRDDIERVRLA